MASRTSREVELCVSPNHDFGIRLGTHCSAQGFAELLGWHLSIIDPQPAGIVDGDQNPASLVTLLLGFAVCGKFTSGPFRICGAITMKMISSTSTTSTSGVNVDGRLHLRWFTEPHKLSPPSLP
jgi:hypothetical protein